MLGNFRAVNSFTNAKEKTGKSSYKLKLVGEKLKTHLMFGTYRKLCVLSSSAAGAFV